MVLGVHRGYRDAPATTRWEDQFPGANLSWSRPYTKWCLWHRQQVKKFRQLVEQHEELLVQMRRCTWQAQRDAIPDRDEFSSSEESDQGQGPESPFNIDGFSPLAIELISTAHDKRRVMTSEEVRVALDSVEL